MQPGIAGFAGDGTFEAGDGLAGVVEPERDPAEVELDLDIRRSQRLGGPEQAPSFSVAAGLIAVQAADEISAGAGGRAGERGAEGEQRPAADAVCVGHRRSRR